MQEIGDINPCLTFVFFLGYTFQYNQQLRTNLVYYHKFGTLIMFQERKPES